MPHQRRLTNDRDFGEALERRHRIRVFRDDHIVDDGGVIIRFDGQTVVVQSGVGDVAFHSREQCEFFERRGR